MNSMIHTCKKMVILLASVCVVTFFHFLLIVGSFVDIREKCPFCESKIFLEENTYSWCLLQDEHNRGVLLPIGSWVRVTEKLILLS